MKKYKKCTDSYEPQAEAKLMMQRGERTMLLHKSDFVAPPTNEESVWDKILDVCEIALREVKSGAIKLRIVKVDICKTNEEIAKEMEK